MRISSLSPRRLLWVLILLCPVLNLSWLTAEEDKNLSPWNLAELEKVPAAEFGPAAEGICEVHYAGESFEGKPTRVFAYYGRPEGDGPFPAMVLVHGGGGKAFKDWVRHWNKRGYAAIAMDLAGNGPEARLPDGGPDQGHETKFRPFTPETFRDVWTYQAVAAVIRAHSLLAAQPAVDKNRIGITGISWGGYLTSIVAGLDHRFKVAVPVYGCGFIHIDSAWVDSEFNKMSPEQRDLWVKYFDPSRYLPDVKCPILFITGTNDQPYPLVIHAQSTQLVDPRLVTLSIIPRLPHGHIWTFPEVDAFVDSVIMNGKPLLHLSPLTLENGAATATVFSPQSVKKVELHYTTDNGKWPDREWKSAPAMLEGDKINAPLPGSGYLACYLAVTDDRGVTSSTLYRVRK